MKKRYSAQQIHQRIHELAEQISKDYEGQEVLLLGVLKGAMIFLAHLLVQLKGDFEINTLTVSSYTGTSSTELKLQSEPTCTLKGRRILLVEDIIDSGKTVHFIKEYLLQKGAAEVEIVTLVDKETKTNVLSPKYVGFHYAEPNFLVGFGFDLDEKLRNLPEIHQL
ncbi:hypoxanthine phosphoribosyltransferase [Candidatus Peregrinibacteria bacterium]|nr:MAG: hypoxanthine phosphoribosyltransferase [Candidatus Peregrinibacteria bacterium]